MNDLKEWLKSVSDNGIKARNKSKANHLALCFNFLQIPETETVVFTMSVMENKKRKNAIQPALFAKILSHIEKSLYDVKDSTVESINPNYYISMAGRVPNSWYQKLGCHRLFFIHENHLWDVIEKVFNSENISWFHYSDVKEITVFVDTRKYDCNLKFH